jgi:hypothetical protein
MNQLGLRSKLSKNQGYDQFKHNHLIMPNVLNRELLPNLQKFGFGYHLHSCQRRILV